MSYGKGMRSNVIKVAICLCVDTSYSMIGTPIEELNRGITAFFDELYKDEIARYSAEISIIEFNSQASITLPFTEVNELGGIQSNLDADGTTAMAEAVELALKELKRKKQEYKSKGVSYYQPWMVLMSDGFPTDDEGYFSESYKSVASRSKNMSKNKELLVIPIGIGDEAELSILSEFSATVPAQRIRDNNFKSFFKWLSASVKSQSRSNKEDDLKLDDKNLDWLVQKT